MDNKPHNSNGQNIPRTPAQQLIDFSLRRRHIKYLMEYRFPDLKMHSVRPGNRNDAAINAFQTELVKRTDSEITAMYERALEAEKLILETRLKAEESNRFFSQPSASVDLVYWNKMALWHADEATAISLGKDPRQVTWKLIYPYTKVSKFAAEYEDMRELVSRAITAGLLPNPMPPSTFRDWAAASNIHYPMQPDEIVVAMPTIAVVKDIDGDTSHEPGKVEGWVRVARKIAMEISLASRNPLSSRELAQLVWKRISAMHDSGDHSACGRGDKILDPSTIKRRALTGIKSEVEAARRKIIL